MPETGVSMGLVQHYFSTKDQLLRFAVEMMGEDVKQRIRLRVVELPQPVAHRQLVRTVLTEMIPNVDRRAIEAEAADVWVRRFLLPPDGLIYHIVTGHPTARGAIAIIEAQLDYVFGR